MSSRLSITSSQFDCCLSHNKTSFAISTSLYSAENEVLQLLQCSDILITMNSDRRRESSIFDHKHLYSHRHIPVHTVFSRSLPYHIERCDGYRALEGHQIVLPLAFGETMYVQ